MIPVIPRGFKDVLPQEARWRESICNNVQKALSLWGYAPIETPTLEVLDVLKRGGQLAPTTFRLFDADGALLVLRPDVTLPIARMTATRLADAVGPLRFRYVQPVFREEESLRGQAREFTQLGIESIGLGGALADAEVVVLLAEALKAAGLKDFTLAICTVGVLRDLLDVCVRESGVGEQWRQAMLDACHASNLVEVARLARDARIDARYGEALSALPSIRGGKEAITACRALVEPLRCLDGLDVLEQTWELIEAAGVGEYVTVDFSVMSSFDYYTGLVIEAYAPGVGMLLGSGGRYDHTLEAYGKSAPAAGFALSLERIMQALLEQGIQAEPSFATAEPVVVSVETDEPAAAFRRAKELRGQGIPAVLGTGKAGERYDG
ncbi:MAG: ATP phosphoribosyltransferase regulatory subunit [Coriobacteriales bacterium]|jgi:ATP phosphoribosyltransferase regulatory subunit|nr:ATP phosphoribosyltransferase regulatory subunit [Coriobacteriales bacterium]